MADYEELIGKPAVAVGEDGDKVRGVMRAGVSGGIPGFAEPSDDPHPMLISFDGSSGQWSSSWMSVTEIPFNELTRGELLAWHEDDPFGYLAAAFAWFRDHGTET